MSDASPIPPKASAPPSPKKAEGPKDGLSDHERARGLVRPLRDAVQHVLRDAVPAGKDVEAVAAAKCPVTILRPDHADVHARTPGLHTKMRCSACARDFPASEFVWNGTDERVGAK